MISLILASIFSPKFPFYVKLRLVICTYIQKKKENFSGLFERVLSISWCLVLSVMGRLVRFGVVCFSNVDLIVCAEHTKVTSSGVLSSLLYTLIWALSGARIRGERERESK